MLLYSMFYSTGLGLIAQSPTAAQVEDKSLVLIGNLRLKTFLD